MHVHHNWFENIERVAIEIAGTTGRRMNNIAVFKNRSLNMQAHDVTTSGYEDRDWPIKWESKFVQFRNVTGEGNMIWENRAVNLPGWSFSTDFINLYESGGVSSTQPLLVMGNKIVGSGAFGRELGRYHLEGAGVQLADHAPDRLGGEFIEATHNVLVFPGTAGMNINGGRRITMSNNTIVMATSMYGFTMGCVPGGNACQGTPALTERVPWKAMTVYNYSGTTGDGKVNEGHTAKNNQAACSNCVGGASWEFKTNFLTDASNNWSAKAVDLIKIAAPTKFWGDSE